MENTWLSHAKQLQAIASTGLHFCKNEFDRERYLQIAEIANTMLCELATVPLTRIEGLVSDFAKGYATPKVDVRGALIENQKILLVREKSTNSGHFRADLLTLGSQREKILQRSL